jgi:hypothetical protein
MHMWPMDDVERGFPLESFGSNGTAHELSSDTTSSRLSQEDVNYEYWR